MLPIDPHNEMAYSFVVFGASGSLAKQKVFPALWSLYRENRFPQGVKIFTFCRTQLQTKTLRLQVLPYMDLDKNRDPKKYNRFWTNVHCVQGEYDRPEHYVALSEAMVRQEEKHSQVHANRIFYLALPPVVFDQVTLNASRKCTSPSGWTRIIVEKPFARDDVSFRTYQTSLCNSFRESQIYLMDHLLSRQVMQNFFALRYSNHLWGETLNNRHVAAVMISVKCELPVQAGRADYFNQFGIIRDLMTNHMIQVLAMLTMDQPYANSADDLRVERLKILRQVLTPNMGDVVLAQYRNNGREADPAKCGYTEHSYVPKDSFTPTFALVVLHINNRRWSGVPFILRAGKAMNDSKSEVRIQYKPGDCDVFHSESADVRNELVLRSFPTEEVFMRMRLKRHGEDLCLRESEISLRVDDRGPKGIEGYPGFLLNVFQGDQTLFMRTDEQCEIWRIFSPILSSIETDRPRPLHYDFGSRGPLQAYRQAERAGFVFFASDEWHQSEEALEYTVKKSKQLIGPHTAFKPVRQPRSVRNSKLSSKS
ncbi:LOW QUALITY PROTEIN: glucose-6-phosphate 1-dehydrogenase [Drosophila rhopaloa]|uniref:Glucose-6-phosphate 1-dehydrogenase n=1 Tax=Drosophila rhopaloa TaxID=1041015 RepID=A0ABM5GWD3_DRORH|nr:LOW QUALITY PROTEIN: glucose-6-phosphate 1-dehydrogenase [Drosophila rhopaloa]